MTRAALLLIAGTLATEVPRIGKRYWLGVCGNRIRANVRADALGGVLSWPAQRLHATSVGEVMARVVGDVEVLGRGASEVIVETWDTLLFSLALAVTMLLYDPTLGLIALAPVPVALVLAKAVGARESERTLQARQADAAVSSFAQEGLTGLRVLRVSGRGAAYTARLRTLADRQAGAELAAARLEAVLAPLYTLLITSGVLAVLWLGGLRVASGVLSVGDLVALLGLFGRFTGRAFRLPQMANRIQAAAAAYTRLAPLLAAPPPLAAEPPRASWRANRVAGLPSAGKRPGSQAAASAASTPRTASAAGPATLCLREVTFTYPGGSAPALAGVTLDVPAGALLAVTGRSGRESPRWPACSLGCIGPTAARSALMAGIRMPGSRASGRIWATSRRDIRCSPAPSSRTCCSPSPTRRTVRPMALCRPPERSWSATLACVRR